MTVRLVPVLHYYHLVVQFQVSGDAWELRENNTEQRLLGIIAPSGESSEPFQVSLVGFLFPQELIHQRGR